MSPICLEVVVLNPIVLNLILFVLGAIIGAIVNWSICQLCYFGVRAISPLGPKHPQAPARIWSDRIPILGWLGMRRESPLHGRGFWIRPMLIELSLACFAPWFYDWLAGGGLLGEIDLTERQIELWFIAYLLLTAFLIAATFIDFDEQTIPDAITLPGTLIGLGFAVVFPDFRLPETRNVLSGRTFEHLDFMSPLNASEGIQWFEDWRGLAVGIVIFAAWTAALTPKIATLRYGLPRGIQFMWASVVRPRRKRTCTIRTTDRGPFGYVYLLFGTWVVLSVVYGVAWYIKGPIFLSLLSSVLGLAFGGGIVWAIRLIAGSALQQEAMGFGDVTLMAMIGSFLGWQPTLLVFGLAPFAALGIALIQFLVSRHRALAYGPYLSGAAMILLLNWDPIWNRWAAPGFFSQPQLLLTVIVLCGILCWPMMYFMRLMRG